MTEEHKRKIGNAQKGEKNHMFGKKQSLETIEKRVSKLRGIPRSEEVKRKIGEAARMKGI